jgi:peptidoglycan/LPS O-acetylase OafA/YrhL
MKRTLIRIAPLLFVLFLGTVFERSMAAEVGATETTGPTVESVQAIRGLVYARPFTLAAPYLYPWSQEGIEVLSGYVLVLDVDPDFAQPSRSEDGRALLWIDRAARTGEWRSR